jgi:methionine aminopeptidase
MSCCLIPTRTIITTKQNIDTFIYSDVCTKYQEAAKIVNLALEGLVTQCVPGAKILDLCEFGTKVMEAAANKLYTKKVNGKTVDRGVAFPVCISVNNIVCNFSPLETEETVSFLVAIHANKQTMQ